MSLEVFPLLQFLMRLRKIGINFFFIIIWLFIKVFWSNYLINKDPSSQSYGFSSSHVWCESWTIKKAEWWRIVAFELWYWRRLLRVPRTARTSNQSILKEISSENSPVGLMLKLKLQYFGHLMWITDLLDKTLMLRKIEGRRRRGWQRRR